MRLEELLIAQGVVQVADLERAAERRQLRGGPLADSLLALRLITLEQLNAALQMTPPALPASVADTGIGRRELLALLLKALHGGGADNIPALGGLLKLPSSVLGSLVDEAIEQKLLKVTGSNGRSTMPVLTYSLTETGRTAVGEAVGRCKYVGPAPVALQSYIDQINRQRLRNERTKRDQDPQGLRGPCRLARIHQPDRPCRQRRPFDSALRSAGQREEFDRAEYRPRVY